MTCCPRRAGWRPQSSAITSKAVRGLLASYHRIDDALNREAWEIEHATADAWIRYVSSVNVAANRDAVIERGRARCARPTWPA